MIYTTTANFPYPVLRDDSKKGYRAAQFCFDLNIHDQGDEYRLEIDTLISSTFLREHLAAGRAELFLVLKGADCFYAPLSVTSFQRKRSSTILLITKEEISFESSVEIQLMIMAKDAISFAENKELTTYFDERKERIVVQPGQMLGFSRMIKCELESEESYNLFVVTIDETQPQDYTTRLSPTMIELVFNKVETKLLTQTKDHLVNLYLYAALQKQLMHLLCSHLMDADIDQENQSVLDAELEISQLSPSNEREEKVLSLLKAKGIKELRFESIDAIIHKIGDGLVGKFTQALSKLIQS